MKITQLILVLALVSANAIAMEQPTLAQQLTAAAKNNQYDRVKELLEQGANPVGTHALWFAAMNGNEEMCKLLIEYGAPRDDFNTLGNTQETPLMAAVQRDDWQMLRFLIEHGADELVATHTGMNFFMQAAYKGNEDVIRTILTTIPFVERNKILTKFEEIKARIIAAQLSLQKSGLVPQKDIRKMIGNLILQEEIQELVNDQMQRIEQMLAMRNSYNLTAFDEAVRGNNPEVVQLLDLNDPEISAWLRSAIEENIRKILFARPEAIEEPVELQGRTVEEHDPFGHF